MGAKAAASHSKRSGRPAAPIQIAGRAITKTFWGSAWCKNLEAYSDYANRLPRGRTDARNGSIVDLHITTGKVEALVQGSSLYQIQITFSTLAAVLYGVGARLDEKPELFFTLRGVEVSELIASATATAAREPAPGTQPANDALDGEDLSALFGVELDSGAAPVKASARATATASATKVRRPSRSKTRSTTPPTAKNAVSKGKAKAGSKANKARQEHHRLPRTG